MRAVTLAAGAGAPLGSLTNPLMRPVTCAGMGVRMTTSASPLRIAARTKHCNMSCPLYSNATLIIITGGRMLLQSDNPELRSGDWLQILPIELVVAHGQLMLLRILIACDPNLLSPLAEGQQHLTINKVAHVDRTIRQVILHIFDLMQEFPQIVTQH